MSQEYLADGSPVDLTVEQELEVIIRTDRLQEPLEVMQEAFRNGTVTPELILTLMLWSYGIGNEDARPE